MSTEDPFRVTTKGQTMTETYELSACTDCLMLIDGDESGIERCQTEEGEAQYLADIDQLTGDLHLVTGDTSDYHFSRSPCEVCGSNLGGDRHLMIGFARMTLERAHAREDVTR